MYERAGHGTTFPQIFIGATHVGGCDELYALDREGKLDGLLASEERELMSNDAIFTAAMVQMRTGLLPEPSLEQGIELIREAAAQGADYVLTPEVSNMMQLNRKALFEHLASEDDDKSLKAYRALAAELKIHLHIGSLALRFSPEKAVNRSFLIATRRQSCSRSYDKIHMFDIDLPGGESYRESANYQPGETAVISDLPWGRIGLTICYDVRFPALYRALAESGASFLTVPSAFTRKTGEAHWHTLLRARAIETGCFVFAAAQAGLHENKRETFGHSLIIDPWGEVLAEGGVEPGVFLAKIDPPRSRPRARPSPRCSTAGASASPTPRPARTICIWCGDRHDPLYAALRPGPRLRKLVPEFVGLRIAGEAQAGDLPGLRFHQGREGHHGAADRQQEGPRQRAARRAAPRRAATE